VKEIQSVRLKDDEQVFLEQYHDSNFSEYVHKSIERDVDLIKRNHKLNFFEGFRQEVLQLGLGAIFFIFSVDQSNWYSFMVLFLIGVFLFTSSLVSIALKLKKRNVQKKEKKEWKHVRQFKEHNRF